MADCMGVCAPRQIKAAAASLRLGGEEKLPDALKILAGGAAACSGV